MKRGTPKKRGGSRAKAKEKIGAEKRESSTPQKPDISDQTELLAGGAQELYGQAHQLDQTSDSPHASIHAMREAVSAPHVRSATDAGSALETPTDSEAIVTEDKRPKKGKTFPVVGIGASAGGYEAFAEFLSQLPERTGMAYVLVQHLDPKHKSQLTQLLRRSSKLPVVQATDGMEVAPDQIYVIPENSTMTIEDGKLRLYPRAESESPPMPIDVFFRSLAQQHQEQAIGVVLSGTGCDGTMGIEAIKGEGGLTFAQDDRSSKYYGMPGSAIASGSVDFVLPPSEIAQELVRIARHPLVGRTGKPAAISPTEAAEVEHLLRESPNETSTLFRLLRARTGVDFSLYKQSTLKRRIIRRMILHKKQTLAQYFRLVEGSASELDALFNDLLINVTNFFRDPQTFQLLKKKIFPRILKAHNSDAPLRFWACGCSTGEEAYSLAMALVEYFEETRSHRPAQIFATDVSQAGINKARAGIYAPNIQQDVSPERLRRFFTKTNGNFQVHKAIRDMCVFARQNVLVDPPFSNLDLVSCRNVLIYFGPALQRRIIPLFHYALRTKGFLLLGNAETIGPSTEHFSLFEKKYKVYLKKPTYRPPAFEGPLRPPELKPQDSRAGAAGSREQKPLDLQQQIDKLLLREFSPATVVVNSQMDVVHFRGRTGRYLEHVPGTASLNLYKMLRDSVSVAVRAMLGKALRHDVPVKHGGIEFRHNGRQFELSIEVVPFAVEPLDERFFAVIFREHPSPVHAPPGESTERAGAGTKRLRRELEKVRMELLATKESMQSIIEEQEATNEELKSANEEIQSSNEELQSTNEELETAKEELQSTNEELTTLNEELQNRNLELSQANNDLQNFLASVNLAILMVGQDLTVRRFTPVAERLFNLIPSDLGRDLTEVNRSMLLPDLENMVRQVIDELTIIEREVHDRDGRWYLLRIRPYRTRENKIEGAVIVLIDVDDLRQASEVVMGMVRQPVLMLGVDMKVRSANASFLESYGLSKEQTVGRLIYELDDNQWNLPQLHTLLEEVLPRHKHASDFMVEAHFAKTGVRKLLVNASRFFEEGKGMPLILLAFEDVTHAGGK